MTSFNYFASAAENAQALAHAVAQDLRNTLAKQPHATLAVSGGKSPIAFFQTLSQIELDWPRVNITLADERIVPTQHADSNTSLVRTHLLQNRAQAARFIPTIDDAADESSLKNTENAVSFALAHFQQPDVLVLGMGGDGHTASIFPQCAQFADAVRADYPAPLLHTTPPDAPHERVSMTLAAIVRTPRVYLAIAGAAKLAVFRQAEEREQAQFPISLVLHQANVQVYFND